MTPLLCGTDGGLGCFGQLLANMRRDGIHLRLHAFNVPEFISPLVALTSHHVLTAMVAALVVVAGLHPPAEPFLERQLEFDAAHAGIRAMDLPAALVGIAEHLL